MKCSCTTPRLRASPGPLLRPAFQAESRWSAGRLAHGFGDVHPHALRVELAERLAALAPFPDAKVVFAQSGAEAVELALKTAQLVTGKPGVLAFLGGFHGQSWGALSVSGWERFRAPFEGDGPAALHPRARFAPYGRCSRCDLGLSYPGCSLACLRDAGRMLENAAELWAWLEEGAHFYVCGDAKRMAKDVEAALLQVAGKAGGKSPEEAKAWLEALKSDKRYLRDVY